MHNPQLVQRIPTALLSVVHRRDTVARGDFRFQLLGRPFALLDRLAEARHREELVDSPSLEACPGISRGGWSGGL